MHGHCHSPLSLAKFRILKVGQQQMCTHLYPLKLGETMSTDICMLCAAWCWGAEYSDLATSHGPNPSEDDCRRDSYGLAFWAPGVSRSFLNHGPVGPDAKDSHVCAKEVLNTTFCAQWSWGCCMAMLNFRDVNHAWSNSKFEILL